MKKNEHWLALGLVFGWMMWGSSCSPRARPSPRVLRADSVGVQRQERGQEQQAQLWRLRIELDSLSLSRPTAPPPTSPRSSESANEPPSRVAPIELVLHGLSLEYEGQQAQTLALEHSLDSLSRRAQTEYAAAPRAGRAQSKSGRRWGVRLIYIIIIIVSLFILIPLCISPIRYLATALRRIARLVRRLVRALWARCGI